MWPVGGGQNEDRLWKELGPCSIKPRISTNLHLQNTWLRVEKHHCGVGEEAAPVAQKAQV